VRSRLLLVAVLLAIGGRAWGHDLLAPTWRGLPDSSVARWEGGAEHSYFWSYDGTLTPPELNWEQGWTLFSGPWNFYYGMYQLPRDYGSSRIVFDMDDYDQDQPEKDIRVQLTFYARDYYEGHPWELRVWTWPEEHWSDPLPAGQYWDVPPAGVVNHGAPYSYWWTVAFDLSLSPNPDSEMIGLDVGSFPWWYGPMGSSLYFYLDEVVIDTICVPEPACLAFFAAGGLLVLRRRRRA
jgi:hypothetical protein